MAFLPEIPACLSETAAQALQWRDLIASVSQGAQSDLGRAWIAALQPSADLPWIEQQQQRTAEMQQMVARGGSFDLRGIFDVTEALDKARIEGAALEPTELRALLSHAERVDAWRHTLLALSDAGADAGAAPAVQELSAPLLVHDLGPMLRSFAGKIEPDGSLSDDASPELARIRRALAQQHRAIEASLRQALTRLSDDGSAQGSLITVRGDRFVIPVKAEFKRKVGGVVHGSSSSGQTVFVEPLETIEHNNELTRLLDEEQAEIHRILVAMTRAVAGQSPALLAGAEILAQVDAHQAIAQFSARLNCVRPSFYLPPSIQASSETPAQPSIQPSAQAARPGAERESPSPEEAGELDVASARHPLLEIHLRSEGASIVPLTLILPPGTRQMIISGPNTGGKTVALKTAGLLAAMAQAGLPVPAQRATLPVFNAIYADIGDAQSIERDLSTFSAHVVNIGRIASRADGRSLVLLDELGSATDPEEGAALAVAVAGHFLERRAFSIITTHLTSLKVYAAQHRGVLNAAVGFDEAALAPTYELRLGVPGASAGLNIAERLGLDPAIVANARAQMTTQQIDIGHFLDELHAQLTSAVAERERLAAAEQALQRERARLEQEGRAEQQSRTRELERQLKSLLEDFESQMRETVQSIDDKTVAQKMARDSALRVAQLRREFSEQFQSTVTAHTAPAQSSAKPSAQREPRAGDLVRLRSLNREGRVVRVLDTKTLEVAVGSMKMRVPRTDIAELIAAAGKPAGPGKGRGGVTVSAASSGGESDSMSSEINVIGRTADEAESEVGRFVERAFLAGLPRIRVVHGVGMGILRRTLREFLRNHPHVTSIAEPPYNEGGQGATIVDLRQ